MNDINKKVMMRFGFEDLPHIKEFEDQTVLILVGSDYTFTAPVPKLPNEVFFF